MNAPEPPHDRHDETAAPVAPSDTWRSLTLDEAAAWGRACGAALPHGAVVALHGDLGTGKTTMARAIAEGLAVFDPDAVTSPTFAIVHEYPSPSGIVVHADLYRLRGAHELVTLGWDELVSTARATIVEWPDRAGLLLPDNTRHVRLAHDSAHADRRLVRTD